MDDTESRARKSGSEKRQKSGIVGFRATPAERAELEAAAERAGYSLSSYVRSRALAAPETRATRRPTVERELLARTLAQLGRLNGNLHQIAKHLNFGGSDITDLPEALAEAKLAGANIMDALGEALARMIISGGSRSNWRFFSKHLMKPENDRVDVAEIRGLLAGDIREAFREMDAVASGTRTKNFFYHANLNPREGETLTPEQWNQAVDTLERNLGLEGHARFVVEHEEGRIHRHAVWLRIDPDTMRAVSDFFTAPIHERTSRELEQVFGLEPVESVLVKDRDTERPSRRPKDWETFRGNHSGVDPQAVKAELTELWNTADSGQAFAAALADHGYILCRGDRRDFCVIDRAGDEHSLARRIQGAKAAEIRARMDGIDRDALPAEEGRDLAQPRQQEEPGQTPAADASTVPHIADPVTAAPEPEAPAEQPSLSVWDRIQEYATFAVEAKKSAVPWLVEEVREYLRSESTQGHTPQRSIDSYAAPMEDAIRADGVVPERDGLTWWQRTELFAHDMLDNAADWTRGRWHSFVEFVERGRDTEPHDPEPGR